MIGRQPFEDFSASDDEPAHGPRPHVGRESGGPVGPRGGGILIPRVPTEGGDGARRRVFHIPEVTVVDGDLLGGLVVGGRVVEGLAVVDQEDRDHEGAVEPKFVSDGGVVHQAAIGRTGISGEPVADRGGGGPVAGVVRGGVEVAQRRAGHHVVEAVERLAAEVEGAVAGDELIRPVLDVVEIARVARALVDPPHAFEEQSVGILPRRGQAAVGDDGVAQGDGPIGALGGGRAHGAGGQGERAGECDPNERGGMGLVHWAGGEAGRKGRGLVGQDLPAPWRRRKITLAGGSGRRGQTCLVLGSFPEKLAEAE